MGAIVLLCGWGQQPKLGAYMTRSAWRSSAARSAPWSGARATPTLARPWARSRSRAKGASSAESSRSAASTAARALLRDGSRRHGQAIGPVAHPANPHTDPLDEPLKSGGVQPDPANGRTAVERLIAKDLDEREGVGRPLRRETLRTARTVHAYLRAGVRPRWMERLMEIERGTRRERRELEAAYRALQAACADDADGFARRWRAFAHSRAFEELNTLIDQHNEWYPVERDLPIDLRTRDYVLISGRSHRRARLGPDWVLEQFPA